MKLGVTELKQYDQMLQTLPLMKEWDMHFDSIEDGVVVGRMALKPIHKNHIGTAHGGVMFLMADTFTGFTAVINHRDPEHVSTVTVNSSFNYLRKGEGDMLYCRCSIVKIGKTLAVVRAELLDEHDALLCDGTFTFQFFER